MDLEEIPFTVTTLVTSCFVLFCLFVISLGRSRGIWRFPGWGSNRSCSHWPTPESQQCRIRATSVTTFHSKAGSLTHGARPGIEPTTSWFLVRYVCAAPPRELLYNDFKFLLLMASQVDPCSAPLPQSQIPPATASWSPGAGRSQWLPLASSPEPWRLHSEEA